MPKPQNQKKIPVIKEDDKPYKVEVKSSANTFIKRTPVSELNNLRYGISDKQWTRGWRWTEYTNKKGKKGKIVKKGGTFEGSQETTAGTKHMRKQYGGKVNTYNSPRKTTYND
tara:strand:+ start:252 stop:590 length:339 start_codon:yes stop_codon:yes gene_type:complete